MYYLRELDAENWFEIVRWLTRINLSDMTEHMTLFEGAMSSDQIPVRVCQAKLPQASYWFSLPPQEQSNTFTSLLEFSNFAIKLYNLRLKLYW